MRELIEKLADVDPDRLVVVSRDPEGSGYSLLGDVNEWAYNPRSGEVGFGSVDDITEKERADGWREWDVISDGQDAVILYPEH